MSNVFASITRGASDIFERQAAPRAGKNVSASGKAGKKAKKKARRLCRNQVAQCQTALTELCGDDPLCLEGLACCDLFATCDTTGALVCIFPDA